MPIDLEKIGKILKDRREEKGLTVNDISDSLCVRKSLIRAMEDGDWSILPHEIYVRGYVKEYAHLIGIDCEISEELSRHIENEPAVEAPPIPVQQKARSPKERRHVQKRVIIYPLIFVLILAFFILNQVYKERFALRSVKKQITEQTSAASVNKSSAITEKQSRPEFVEVKKLMITCHERTWISIVIDDNEKKEFMLNPQDILVLNAKDNFDLLIGNAGGVKLMLNGKDVQLSGQSGEVKRVKVS